MKIDNLFGSFNISALGLSAQRKRMNAIANNISNAETTRTEDGTPYRRKIVTVQEAAAQPFVMMEGQSAMPLATTDGGHMATSEFQFGQMGEIPGGVESRESEDMSDFKLIHDPTHPDADENGYVKMPNVNIVTEMVDMMSASRAYEANITVINAQKQAAKDSLEI